MHVNNFAKTIALIEECAKLCCAILSPGSTLDNGREIFLVSRSTNPSNRQFHILDESSAGKRSWRKEDRNLQSIHQSTMWKYIFYCRIHITGVPKMINSTKKAFKSLFHHYFNVIVKLQVRFQDLERHYNQTGHPTIKLFEALTIAYMMLVRSSTQSDVRKN